MPPTRSVCQGASYAVVSVLRACAALRRPAPGRAFRGGPCVRADLGAGRVVGGRGEASAAGRGVPVLRHPMLRCRRRIATCTWCE